MPPMQEQEHLRPGHDREAGDRPAERHRAGVAHEDLGGEGVVPEEADRRPDQGRGEDRDVEVDCRCGRRARPSGSTRSPRSRGTSAAMIAHGARSETVDAVREVDAVHGARDHEEEERVVERSRESTSHARRPGCRSRCREARLSCQRRSATPTVIGDEQRASSSGRGARASGAGAA